ncbi:MAG: TIGR01777 family oxidoreductase [Desulfobacteraceae bacterium]|nr:TIGR01777 family oxidoreductase [Desulfobacteraceae bacterium]
MKFFIIGGTGFVGMALINYLLGEGHEVTLLARGPVKNENLPKDTAIVYGNPLERGAWQEVAVLKDVIINLAGQPIMTRWTREARSNIMESRVRSTRMAVEAMAQGAANLTLINANAVGYYGGSGLDRIFTEESSPGEDFLAKVCIKWQEEAEAALEKGARVVIARFGAVLGVGGGILGQMIPVFKLGIGGRLGGGNQWFSWLHIHDLCRAVLFAAQNKDISGVVNMTSPNPVTNKEFTKILADILGRPAILPVPGFVLRLAIGGAADLALKGQRVIPAVLEKAGFGFDFPTVDRALSDILDKWTFE